MIEHRQRIEGTDASDLRPRRTVTETRLRATCRANAHRHVVPYRTVVARVPRGSEPRLQSDVDPARVHEAFIENPFRGTRKGLAWRNGPRNGSARASNDRE